MVKVYIVPEGASLGTITTKDILGVRTFKEEDELLLERFMERADEMFNQPVDIYVRKS